MDLFNHGIQVLTIGNKKKPTGSFVCSIQYEIWNRTTSYCEVLPIEVNNKINYDFMLLFTPKFVT